MVPGSWQHLIGSLLSKITWAAEVAMAPKYLSIEGFQGTLSTLWLEESNNILPLLFLLPSLKMQQVKLLIEFRLDFIKYS